MTDSHVNPPRVWPSRQPSIGAARFFANLSQACSAAEYCRRMLLSDDYRVFDHARGVKYSSKVFGFDAVNWSPLICVLRCAALLLKHALR
jgi:hypothetical protein